MFYDFSVLITYLKAALPELRKNIRGAADFIEAFENTSDYAKPSAYIVPVNNEFIVRPSNCQSCSVEDFFDVVTVAACMADGLAYNSSKSSRTLRGRVFNAISEYPMTLEKVKIVPVSGTFLRARKDEYWYGDRYKISYQYNDIS